ncbi:hypothetical protein EVAR_96170_1 [Eumeta japonica]|uniref:Uncharacterized protein n=1 Tax=Eumeta variegata TaxID=151549 RepID=A0A4C1VHH7_EUMVA|nr:hypothetical protein EVAR_96170_1 [Eumeta japonica]
MKTKYSRFSLPSVRHGSGTISVRNKELKFVNSTVYLGITLDNRLQWGPHIKWLRERIILATKNDIVNGINNIIQEMILGEENIYMLIDIMSDE